MADRMAIIVFSGTMDKLTAVATLTAGAAAMDMEVDLFLTFWGIEAVRKDAKNQQPRITAEYADYAPMMMQMMQAKNVPHWLDTLKNAREIGTINVYACSATMELFGIGKDDLDDIVDEVTGVANFIEMAKNAKISLFI